MDFLSGNILSRDILSRDILSGTFCLGHFVRGHFVRVPSPTPVGSFIDAIPIAPLQVRYYSEALPTEHEYCAGVSHRSATGNCELRTCPRYVATRAGFEPTTPRSKGLDSTNAPPRPTTSTRFAHYSLVSAPKT